MNTCNASTVCMLTVTGKASGQQVIKWKVLGVVKSYMQIFVDVEAATPYPHLFKGQLYLVLWQQQHDLVWLF